MPFLSHTLTTAEIIRRAATLAADTSVLQQRDGGRILEYYDALNEFLQSFARTRPWWWLSRESGFATEPDVSTYRLRLLSRASVVLAENFDSGDSITISGRTYGYDTGDVELDLDGTETVAAAAATLAAAINADTSAECFAAVDDDDLTKIWLFWLGEDGDGEAVSASGISATVTAFAYHMPDFSRICGANWHLNEPLRRLDPELGFSNILRPLASLPAYYCLDGAVDRMRIVSHSGGPPDAAYHIRIRYQARPSALLPDGRGDLDFPEEFHDLLPHAIVLLMKAGHYDDSAIWGDEWMQRRLAELESHQIDLSPEPMAEQPATDLRFRIDTRVET